MLSHKLSAVSILCKQRQTDRNPCLKLNLAYYGYPSLDLNSNFTILDNSVLITRQAGVEERVLKSILRVNRAIPFICYISPLDGENLNHCFAISFTIFRSFQESNGFGASIFFHHQMIQL